MLAPLLLHVCCGPCALMTAQTLLAEGFDVIFWFMNPNIHPLKEYLQRREAAKLCAARLHCGIIFEDDAWDLPKWLNARLKFACGGSNQENIPHSGNMINKNRSGNYPGRCYGCISQRIRAAARKAAELEIPFFSTSLLYSRYQPHDYIAKTGFQFGAKSRFIYRDFRKYWQKGIEKSRDWGLYRQQYCGCIFSEAERYQSELKQVI